MTRALAPYRYITGVTEADVRESNLHENENSTRRFRKLLIN
jgi:hypothetical protein